MVIKKTKERASFFTDKNGATPQLIGLEALQQGASGICVVTAQEIQHQLDSILKNNLSIEPAALVIIGESDVPFSAGNRCIHKAIPAHISGKPVALSVRILSVSDEAFRMPESKVVAGDQTDMSTVVMVQVWKDETRSEVFQVLEKGFVAFLKEQGFEQAKHISQVWSSSFFRQKNRVRCDDATYFHCVFRTNICGRCCDLVDLRVFTWCQKVRIGLKMTASGSFRSLEQLSKSLQNYDLK